MTADQVANLMVQRGYKVRKEAGGYRTACPAHGGTDPNMTIRSHAEGGVICTCHSHHCSRPDIAKALELTMAELTNGSGKIEMPPPIVLSYHDEDGKPLYEIVRKIDPQTGKKTFIMRLPGEESGGVGDVRRVLFRLPELLQTKPGEIVGIAEGEKCALAVTAAGICCTTNPNGAGKWRKEYTEWLKARLPDRRFIVFPDNDGEGWKHADTVFHSLRHAGLKVHIAQLEGLSAKGDVYDWLKAHGAAALKEAVDPARRLAKGEVDAADLLRKEFEPVKWAIEGVLPEGLAIFAGPSKSCKSWLCCEIGIAMVTGGKVFGQIPCIQGDVLYLALEDSERRLKDRIGILLRGAAMPRGMTIKTDADIVGQGLEEYIEDWLSRHPAARLVIVDVLQKVRPPKEPGVSEYEQDYQVLTSLQKLCRDHRVAMLIVHHTRKMKADDPYDMISGSTAIQGAADTIMALMRTRGEADATLHYTGRDVDSDALALEWDEKECGWRLIGKAKENKLTGERKLILEFLQREPEPVTPAILAGILGKNPHAIQFLLGKLCEEGLVTKMGHGKYAMSEYQRSSAKFSDH